MPLSPRGYSGAAAIPEAGAVGSVPRTAASPDPFGILIGRPYSGLPRDGVGLSPVSVDGHCVQAKPPATLSSHDDNRVACRERRLRDAAVLPPNEELGTST